MKAAGMLKVARYQPPSGPAVDIDVGFRAPDALLLDGQVQSTQYEVEYQTADMPALKLDETLTIDGTAYKVRTKPEKRGDGFFSTAMLSKS